MKSSKNIKMIKMNEYWKMGRILSLGDKPGKVLAGSSEVLVVCTDLCADCPGMLSCVFTGVEFQKN